MKIVMGRRGSDHITSNDFQSLMQGIFGDGNIVLNLGQTFAATVSSPTELQILDGEGIMQGVHFRVVPGTMDIVNLTAGQLGLNRVDLVCARYTKDTVTGVEDVNWYVVEGTPSSGDPVDPEYITGDIRGGDTVVDFPMFRIVFTETTPAVTPLFLVKNKINSTNWLLTESQRETGYVSYYFSIPMGKGLDYIEMNEYPPHITGTYTIRLSVGALEKTFSQADHVLQLEGYVFVTGNIMGCQMTITASDVSSLPTSFEIENVRIVPL